MKNQAILCLLLITITITITTKAQARSLLQSPSCSSSCGDIPRITYPFRLKGDPATCGDPDYELSCENNKTTLNLYSAKFFVKKISYTTHTIRLVDVNLSNGTCSLPSGSLSSDQIKWVDFRYRGWSFRSYTSFVRCSENITELGFLTVPCESRNGSYVYAKRGSDLGISSALVPKSCELISVAPGDTMGLKNNHSYGDIVKFLQSGFNLGWSVECRDCLQSGDSCAITSFNDPIMYGCSSNDIISEIVTLTWAVIWLVLVGIHLFARFILVPIFLIGFFIYKCRSKSSGTTQNNVQQG